MKSWLCWRGLRAAPTMAALFASSALAASPGGMDTVAGPPGNDYRTAGGAPGQRYWQQAVDYDIAVRLDERTKSLIGREQVVYRNNSPDALAYLWFALDQNAFQRHSMAEASRTVAGTSINALDVRLATRSSRWRGGFTIQQVIDDAGRALEFSVVDGLMRVELPRAVSARGGQVRLSVHWTLPLVPTASTFDRSGYECFEVEHAEASCIFQAGQWFPRLAAYSDYAGWHLQPFLGLGEFTLEFGNYRVAITVPADHIVSSTGELDNAAEILSSAQRDRLRRARTSDEPMYVVTPEEAQLAEQRRRSGEKTWIFKADNVRDVAWASSRSFIWDAMGVAQASSQRPVVMAMSFFPRQARPLWDAYSTRAIAHTLLTFSEFTFPYPYPVAQSVNGPVGGNAPSGMEYPMIGFNGARPERDPKTGQLSYGKLAKQGLIGTVIHETGHNYFPMIVNSDERQWAWMDEGLNSFLEYQALRRWDPSIDIALGEPRDIVEYMQSPDQVPVMTRADALVQFGRNAYAKPATALVILRETVLGREAFDRAFREYAQRWRFKRPTPHDFFRSIEQSSGRDLSWFWEDWFFSTRHVDIALDDIVCWRIDSGDPDTEAQWLREQRARQPVSMTTPEASQTVETRDPATRDFYSQRDEFAVTSKARRDAETARSQLTAEDAATLATADRFYRFTFRNVGGVIMPVLLRLEFSDGTIESVHIPAEVWRRDRQRITWQYLSNKSLVRAAIDPRWETADADRRNNVYARDIETRTFTLRQPPSPDNSMRDEGLIVTPDSLVPTPSPHAP